MAKSIAKSHSAGKSAGKSSPVKSPGNSSGKGKSAVAAAAKGKPMAKAAPVAKPKGKSAPAVKEKKPAAAPVKAEAAKRPSAEPSGTGAGGHSSHESAPIPAAMLSMPADGKPRKNQAGLGARDLEHFRELLLAKRRELVGDVSSMEREALRTSSGTNLSTLPMHMADMGTDNYEQEFTLGLVEKDRGLLREINSALSKMMTGVYGLCEGTGKPISKARLEAQPWARFSIEYARQMERGHRMG